MNISFILSRRSTYKAPLEKCVGIPRGLDAY